MTKKPLTEREVNRINCERWHKDAIKYNKLPSMPDIKLKRIPINTDRNNQEYNNIKEGAYYLVNYSSHWYLGIAEKVWYGYDVNIGSHSVGFSACSIVYEVLDLPKIPSKITRLMPLPENDEEEDI